jgi:hypothetical protein
MLEWLKLWDYKLWLHDHLQWHDFSAEFHENLPLGSKFISGGYTDRLMIS